MPKRTDDPKVHHLCKSENFSLASEIYEIYPKVIEALHIKFWTRLADQIAMNLKNHPGWILGRAEPDKAPGDQEYGIAIQPLKVETTKLYSRIRVEQQKASYSLSVPLIYGVAWSDHQAAKKLRDGAAKKLRDALLEREFKTTDWWAGYKPLWDLRSRDILEKLAEANESLEIGLAKEIGQIVEDLGELVKEANRQTGAMK
jgi:hypothetical protein